jgi:hypothetical protein
MATVIRAVIAVAAAAKQIAKPRSAGAGAEHHGNARHRDHTRDHGPGGRALAQPEPGDGGREERQGGVNGHDIGHAGVLERRNHQGYDGGQAECDKNARPTHAADSDGDGAAEAPEHIGADE